MTVEPHSRTTTEIAAQVDAALVRCLPSYPGQLDEANAALAELRSRAEQTDQAREEAREAERWRVQAASNAAGFKSLRDEERERAEGAERERDHMRAVIEAAERLAKYKRPFMGEAFTDLQESIANLHASRAGLFQPGNTQP